MQVDRLAVALEQALIICGQLGHEAIVRQGQWGSRSGFKARRQRDFQGRMAGADMSMRGRSVSGACVETDIVLWFATLFDATAELQEANLVQQSGDVCSLSNNQAGLCPYTVGRPVMSAPHPSSPAGGSTHCQPINDSTECLPLSRRATGCLGQITLNWSTCPPGTSCSRVKHLHSMSTSRPVPSWC